jgi:hypothetical protein
MSRSLRIPFGERQIKASVDRLSPDLKSSVSLRQVNAGLGLTTERYSPLLHCCRDSSGLKTSDRAILAIIPLQIKRDQDRRLPGFE